MIDETNFPFVYPPLKHQMEEFVKYRDAIARGLLWDPGTGKSKTAIDKMAYLYLSGKIDTAIVMAKKGEYTNWKYVEIPEHMPKEVPYQCEVYRSTMKEYEKQKLRDLVKPGGRLRILNINAESLLFEGGQMARAFIASSKVGCFFVLDESTLAKSHKSKRSKEVYKLADRAKYRMIMTGTFAPNNSLDVWGQARVLGLGVLGMTSFMAYKGEYCREEMRYFGQKSFKQITGSQNLEKLGKLIRTFASIKERHECMDLPPKIYKKVMVPLTDEQQENYETMRDMAFAEFREDELIIEATTAMEIVSKMDQIAVGQLKLEGDQYRILDNNRVEMLLTNLENSNAQGIIWCNYRGMLQHIYGEIQRTFGLGTVARYYGGVKDDERENAVAGFQRGDIRWIVANQQSLGYGRTLIAGTENHYVSNGYNLEHRLQSEDRTMRLGQTSSVLYYDYYSKDTINEKIYAALRAKKSIMSEILGTSIRQWI